MENIRVNAVTISTTGPASSALEKYNNSDSTFDATLFNCDVESTNTSWVFKRDPKKNGLWNSAVFGKLRNPKHKQEFDNSLMNQSNKPIVNKNCSNNHPLPRISLRNKYQECFASRRNSQGQGQYFTSERHYFCDSFFPAGLRQSQWLKLVTDCIDPCTNSTVLRLVPNCSGAFKPWWHFMFVK